MCCSVLQCVAVCCSVLQCVVVCCSVLQCVADCVYICLCVWSSLKHAEMCCIVLQFVAVCYSVLQCVAVCCSVLQCVTVCCRLCCRLHLLQFLWSFLQQKYHSCPMKKMHHSASYSIQKSIRMLYKRPSWGGNILVRSLNCQVTFEKEPHLCMVIRQDSHNILGSLQIVAIPYRSNF